MASTVSNGNDRLRKGDLRRRLLKLTRKKIITGFFFTPQLFLATKVAISFVYYSPKTIKCTQKPKIEKSLQESTNRASERVPFSTSSLQLALAHARNSRVKNAEKCRISKISFLPHTSSCKQLWDMEQNCKNNTVYAF